MAYFTDRELGQRPAINDKIEINVWNGIVVLIDGSIANNFFAKEFPELCPDGQGICGVNLTLFYDKIRAVIPRIDVPITRKETITQRAEFNEQDTEPETIIETFSVLDLIEFCYEHINDSEQSGKFHDFFNHYHLKFNETNDCKKRFRVDINQLFERNGVAYKLNELGKILRIIPQEFQQELNKDVLTQDATLNELLNQARQNIILPNPSERTRALEKLWDAFERVKTYYSENKRASIDQLIHMVANGNTLFEEYLQKESSTLTEIGNRFQIRHFEADKQAITDLTHIDYLFLRLFSLINLFVKKLE